MSELLDVVDELGIPTGEVVPRTVAHSEGILHRTAQIWIVRRKPDGADVVMQKRSMNKDSFPGRYDTSSAGHIQAGDEPLVSALRELGEELGIEAVKEDIVFIGNFRNQYEREFHGKTFRDNEVAFVYAYEKPVVIENLVLQEEELDSVKWIDYREALARCEVHDPAYCAPVQGLRLLGKYLYEGQGMETKFGKMFYSIDSISNPVAPEIRFIRALADRDADTALQLFDEEKQFGGLSAVDSPHGRYEGKTGIRKFIDSWYSTFHATGGKVEIVNQIRSGCRSALEYVFIFRMEDGNTKEIPMACAADLRDGLTKIDEIRTYMNPMWIGDYPKYRPPIFKPSATHELRFEMLSGVMPKYFETVHTLGMSHIVDVMTRNEDVKFGTYGPEEIFFTDKAENVDAHFASMMKSPSNPVKVPAGVFKPEGLNAFVELRMETIIDDGRICCVEWEQLITERGRKERGRLSEPGISFYERANDGWIRSVRIIDYANTERSIDWSTCPYDRETAEAVNYLGE